MATKKPRLLVLSHVDPTSRQSGQQQRVYYSLVALRRHFHVTFVGFADAGELEQKRRELLSLCDEVQLLPSLYTRSAASRLWHRLAGWEYQRRTGLKFSNYVIGRLEFHPSRLAPLLAGRTFKLALMEYVHAADSVTLFQENNIPCVLDMHNILWQSYARQINARGIGDATERVVNRYRVAEESAWNRFDALIAISAGERDYVKSRLAPGKHLFYAPMGIPLDDWPYSWKSAQPHRIAYYGGLGSPHNAADARRCHQKIMPLIWKSFPDAEFWIIGSNPPRDLTLLAQRDRRVKVTDFVDPVQDVLKHISVLLCPFTGTYGFRSRVIEAMALGVPVVATPDAVYGMDLEDKRGLFLANTDESMAGEALRLLGDAGFAAAQSREARRQVEEKYSFENSYGRLAKELFEFADGGEPKTSAAKNSFSIEPMASDSSEQNQKIVANVRSRRASASFMVATSWDDRSVSRQFRAVGTELVSRGHRVFLLIDRHNRSAENHHGNPAVFTWPSIRPTRFKDARFLSTIIRQHRPDCLISNFGSVNLMTLVGWCHGVKHRIVWHHTLSSQTDTDTPHSVWKLDLLRWRKRYVWRFATAIAAVSDAAKKDLQIRFRVPEAKCHVIYNSLEDPLRGQAAARTLSGENRILCVARFHRSKGQDVLLRALALLKPEFPKMRIEFLGEGPLRPECERLAAELKLSGCCRFAGEVSHEKVLDAMAHSDVTVVPSRNEAFGLVALESLAMGTPVVASAVGGLTEIMGDGLRPLLVPPDDPEALAKNLKLLLSDSSSYSQFSLRARTRFIQEFEQSAAVKRLADWLEDMVSNYASGRILT